MFESKSFHIFPRVTIVISFNQMSVSIFTLFLTINAAVWEVETHLGCLC